MELQWGQLKQLLQFQYLKASWSSNTTMKKVVALHEKHMILQFQIFISYYQVFIFYYHNYLLR